MQHGFLSTFILAATLALQATTVAARAQDAHPDLGANAALKYWQAFAFLPTLDKDQQKLLEDWNKVPLDGAAQALIDRYRLSRADMHRAANLHRCDWAEDYDEGIRMLLPHLPKSVTLARLAALNARREFAQGHWVDGAEDVTALMGLARHLQTDRIMIANLVGPTIEAMAIEVAAPYLPDLKRALPEAAFAALEPSAPGSTLPEMVLMEKKIGPVWLIGELKASERRKEGSWKSVWDEVFLVPNEGGRNPDSDVARAVKTFDQAVKALEGILPWYDELTRLAVLPREEFDAQYPEFSRKARAASPVGALLLPALDRLVEARRRSQARRLLFQAAIAVVKSGPEALKGIKDPFGNGPIQYRALDNGFELKSNLIHRGQPVTLVAGQGNKS
jgi:hypothetical protein